MFQEILAKLPYTPPFLFVDALSYIDEEKIEGTYTFKEDEHFYAGHFPGNPITPGVILIECMAQIGLVAFGISLLENESFEEAPKFVFASSEVNFHKPVYPGETVTVQSEKIYFRMKKLRCNVRMLNAAGELICKGNLSGIMLRNGLKNE